MSSIDDILFSPISPWREKCRSIEQWIIGRYGLGVYPLTRNRPVGALTLIEFLEAFYIDCRVWFWRIDINKITCFQFNGKIWEANEKIAYPAYEQADPMAEGVWAYRSIEDANLVPNTYTNYFIFRTEAEAKSGVNFLAVP